MYSYFDNTSWVTPFGLIFVAALLAIWFIARRNAVVSGIDGSHIDLLMPINIVVGMAGGALIAMFMPMDHMVAGDAMNHGIRIRLFGMLASGSIAMLAYSRIAGVPFRKLLDAFALPTLVGLMIHRIGCFVAGCCWGDVVALDDAGSFASQVQSLPALSSLASGVQYPPGSLPFEQHVALGLIEPGAAASLPIVPVQLYEALLLLIMLVMFWRVRWRRFPAGTLTVVVTASYALMRFFVEYLRADGHIFFGNLTITQIQCLVLMASALLLPGMLREGRNPTPV